MKGVFFLSVSPVTIQMACLAMVDYLVFD